MKNTLLTFLISFLSFTSYSQSFELYYGEENVSNGEINIQGTASQDEFKVVINISNLSESDKSIKIKKEEISVVEGTFNSFCLGMCYDPTVYESTVEFILEAGQISGKDDFYVEYFPQNFSGVSTIAYEVFDAENPDDKVTVTVNFNIVPTGIGLHKQLAKLNAYPNPVSGSILNISYTIPNQVVNSKISLYNILGIKVIEMPIYELSSIMEVNISKLPKGVYFYSLEADSKNILTKKVIVR